MSKSRARLLAELLNASGRVKKDKSDLAGADSIIDLDTLPTITNAKLENSSISIADHTVSLGGSVSLNTGDITEHTDYKYYTDARVRAAISVDGSLSYNSTTGVLSYTTPTTIASLSNHDTDDLAEGTNLYFTNARARSAISVGGNSLSYNSSTGVITSNYEESPSFAGTVTAQTLSINTNNVGTTTDIALTDNAAIVGNNSISWGLTSTSGYYRWLIGNTSRTGGTAGGSEKMRLDASGNLTLSGTVDGRDIASDGSKLDGIAANANNYVLPFTDNSSNWNTAYSWGNHASAGYLTSHQSLAAYATLASPALTGTPTAPTASAGTNTTQIATTAFVSTAVSNLVDSAPGTLNTLNELAAALGDDANFSTTVTNSIATKLPLSGGTVTGAGTTALTVTNTSGNGGYFNVNSNVGAVNTDGSVGLHIGWNKSNGGREVNMIFDGGTSQADTEMIFTSTDGSTYTDIFQINGGGNVDIKSGDLRMGTTSVIDSTSFRGRAYLRHTNSNIAVQLDNNTYTMFKNPLGETRLWLGSSGYSGASSDTNNYYNGSTHFFRDTGSNESARISGLGVDAKSGGFLINGTSVINSSRNIHNVGTISSGAITSSGQLSLSGNNIAVFGPNSGWSASLAIGGNANNSTSSRASIGATNGNLHIDAATGSFGTYLNFYDGGLGVAFGGGGSVAVAWMGPDGDLWKGTADNSGSKYWHAGNDGTGSGLDADYLDGIQGSQFLRSDAADSWNSLLTYNGSNNGLEVGGIRGTALGSQTGDFIHLYERVNIGYPSGWGASGAAAPAYGLSTWGGAQINIGNVSNAPFTFNGNNVWHAGNDGSGSGLDADTVDGYELSHMFRTASYTSGYSSTSDQWYTLFSISEHTTPVYVTLKNGAHSTATFVVSTGYSGSNEADLTVLNSTWTQNGGYPGAQRVRVAKQSNGTYDVQIKLHWTSSTVAGFNLYCKMWGSTPASALPSFVSSLSADTGSPTVIREARCDLDRMNFSTVPYVGDNLMWHAGNDGPGSGLAADTVDGLHASSFLRSDAADTATGNLTFEGSFLSKGYSSGDNWMPYTDGNFYIRSPNTHFDANVEFNDEARVVTGSIASSNSTKGLMFDGNYQTGQYRHRFRKQDLGAGLPLFIDYSHGTANSYSAVASFGGPGSNYNEFTVYGDQDIQGQLIIDNNIASPANYYNGLQIEVRATSGTAGIGLHRNGYSHAGIYHNTSNRLDIDFNSGDVIINHNAGTLWGSGNDGSGSGLDADLLDGINSSSFLRSDQSDSMSGELNVTHNGGATGTSAPSYSQANIELQTSSNHVPAISFHRGGYSATTLYEYDGELYTSAWTTRSQTGKLISSGNYGSYALPLSGGTVTGTITLGSGGSIDASSNDRYLNFRVIRNAGTANLDGMYIGYGNSNSGHTRLFGGGATSGGLYIRGSGANDLTYGNNTGVIWHSANDGSGSGLDADRLDGLDSTDYRQYTWRSFTVGGDLDKFYPALFSVGNGNHGSSDLEIAQSNVHQNGSSHGAFYARFGLNITGWGHVPQMTTLREYTKSGNTYISKIADTDHATGEIGIWLRGSTTYYYRCSDGAIFDSVRCTDNQPFKSYDSANDAHDITITHATTVEDSKFNTSMHSGNVVMTSTIGNYAWTSSNDGSGSALDADLLDGVQGTNYFRCDGTYPNTNMNTTVEGYWHVVNTASNLPVSQYGHRWDWDHVNNGQWVFQMYSPTSGNPDFWLRQKRDYSAQTWQKVWTSVNDGGGSGLDADLLDGQQGSYYQPASSAITTGNIGSQTVAQSYYVSGSAFATTSSPSSVLEYQQAASITDTKLAPSSDWHNSIRMGHGNPYSYYSNTIAVRMTGSGLGDLYTQTISNNNAQGWNKHWHANNDGSGSGLDADLLDGYQASAFPLASGTNTWGNNGINYFRVERGGYSGSINTANLQAYTTGSNSAFMSFHRSGSYAVNMGLDADNVLRIGGWSASANRWVLDMSGNMTAAGNVTAYSDIRLKENIEVIPNALEKVNQIRGVTFTRNDQDDKEARHTGVIAQEVEKVLPEVISEDNLGIKNVAYGNMVGLLIEAVKELKQEVDDLKAQLKEK